MDLRHTPESGVTASRKFTPDGSGNYVWSHSKEDNGCEYIGPEYKTLLELVQDSYRFLKEELMLLPYEPNWDTLGGVCHPADLGKLLMAAGKLMWMHDLNAQAVMGDCRDTTSDDELIEVLVNQHNMDSELATLLCTVNIAAIL